MQMQLHLVVVDGDLGDLQRPLHLRDGPVGDADRLDESLVVDVFQGLKVNSVANRTTKVSRCHMPIIVYLQRCSTTIAAPHVAQVHAVS